MLAAFLAVDTLNGFLMLGLGLDVSISAIYKALLLSVLLVYLCLFLPKKLVFIFFAFFALCLGEIGSIFSLESNGDKLMYLFQHISKVLSSLILLFFLIDRAKRDPNFFIKIFTVIKINSLIFLLNMLVGYLGFGFSTYGMEGESAVGSKGYFYAGNEVSALLIVFCAFYVASAYIRNKIYYLIISVLYISIGFFISTKTAIFGTLLIVLLVPILYEGRRIFLLNNMTSLIFLSTIMALIMQAVFIYEAFSNTAIYSRISFILENYGLVGVLFSSRDIFLLTMWELFVEKGYLLGTFLGHGISYYSNFTKYSVEMDIFDMFFWHGLAGAIIILVIFISLTYPSWSNFSNPRYQLARIVLVTNLMLLVMSNFSGHIFTSGMLAFIWPCFVMFAYYDSTSFSNK